MPETLTESFCERCGTRYEFKAPNRLNTLRKTRGLVSGLRNYILSQDTLSDAVGDAMRSEEEELASHQLEAFHSAFNFCIDCRQYACTNCWNDAAGRCRSCAPIPGKDDLADRLEAAYLADHAGMHARAAVADLEADDISHRLGVEAWPQSDLAEAGMNGTAADGWPSQEVQAPTAEPEVVPMTAEAPSVEAPEPQAELVAAMPEGEPELELHPILGWEEDADLVVQAPIEEALPEAAAEWVAATEPPQAEWIVAPEESLSPEWFAEPAAPEPAVAEQPLEPEADPVATMAADELEPEPIAAMAAEPEPEPIAAIERVAAEEEPAAPAEPTPQEPERRPAPTPIPFTRIAPVSETIIRPPRQEPRHEPPRPIPVQPPARPVAPPIQLQPPTPIDEGALAARRAQLDLLGLEDPGVGTVGPERRVLPYRSSGAAAGPAELVHRTTTASSALWDASSREVAAARSLVAVQSCGSCGLSLSASARFCRRCGTRQAQPA